jgi:hypothetical protein
MPILIVLGVAAYTVLVLSLYNEYLKKNTTSLLNTFEKERQLNTLQLKERDKINEKLLTMLRMIAQDSENELSNESARLLLPFKDAKKNKELNL